MSTVSRETSLGLQTFINIDELWFKDFLLMQENIYSFAWSALMPKHKEDWLKAWMNPNNLRMHDAIRLPLQGLVLQDQIVKHNNAAKSVVKAGVHVVSEHVVLMPGCVLEAGAYLDGPTVLGAGSTVRHGAYIRGGVMTGENCVIGHSTEVKSSIFANDAKAAHFAYVGDSILGNGVNLGAGTKLSNLKIVAGNIHLHIDGKSMDTGLRKFGAILGDACQTGCNSVLNPGVVLGKGSLVYPCVAVKKGLYPKKTLIK